jgi:hypothetical protein
MGGWTTRVESPLLSRSQPNQPSSPPASTHNTLSFPPKESVGSPLLRQPYHYEIDP